MSTRNSNTQDKINKEISAALDAGIFSYYDPASTKYECWVCPKIGYGDIVPHISSTQHKNSVAWETINIKMPSEAMLSLLHGEIKEAKINNEIEAVDKKVFSYQCKICIGKRPFNGLAPLTSHITGGDHKKNKTRFDLSRVSHAEMTRGDNQLKFDSPPRMNPQTPIPKNYQYLNNGAYSQDQYIHQPDTHSTTCYRSSLDPDKPSQSQYWPPQTSADTLEASNSSKANYRGEVNPQRSSPSYSQQNYYSRDVADAINAGIIIEKENSGYGTSYLCKACGVPLTGLKPVMQHLDSIKHQRKVEGSKMFPSSPAPTSQFPLSPAPTSSSPGPVTLDFGTPNALNKSALEALSSGDVEEQESGYFCKVCNVPLTGPMPLNQHADSEKHRRKVELTKSMMNLKVSQPISKTPVSVIGSAKKYHCTPTNFSQSERTSSAEAVTTIINSSNTSDSKIINASEPERETNQKPRKIDNRIYFKWSVKSCTSFHLRGDVYCNVAIPRGGVFIFNYLFTNTENERVGADVDSQNLKILFTRMGYRVWLYEDFTKEQTLSKLKEIQEDQSLYKFDTFICVILSHGRDDSKFCTMTEDMDFDEVRYHFTDSVCPQLKNKPKIFLVNFCRGKVKEKYQKIENDFIGFSDRADAPKDMFTIYSSIKNFLSLRHTAEGTLFVQAVCKVFAEKSHELDMNDLFSELITEMNEREGTTPESQNYGFRKRFFFNPMNIEENESKPVL